MGQFRIKKTYISNDTPTEDWGKVSSAVPFTWETAGCPTSGRSEKFRLYDDDGILYFSGELYGDDNANGFEPIDMFGTSYGCTEIKYWDKNRDGNFGWHTL